MINFAPANRKRGEKRRRYVPRHIELTAVLKRDFKNKQKESKRIERLEKRLANSSKKQSSLAWQTIYDEEFDPGSG